MHSKHRHRPNQIMHQKKTFIFRLITSSEGLEGVKNTPLIFDLLELFPKTLQTKDYMVCIPDVMSRDQNINHH